MSASIANEKLMKKYLLGELSETETARLEDLVFVEGEQLELLQTVEDELIEAYLDGELLPNEREKFERLFLAVPQRQQKLKLVKALKEQAIAAKSATAPQPASSSRSWFRELMALFQSHPPALIFAATLLLCFSLALGWLINENRRLNQQYQQLAAQPPTAPVSPELSQQLSEAKAVNERLSRELAEERNHNAELTATLAKERVKAPLPVNGSTNQTPNILSFSLIAGLMRGEQGQQLLKLPNGLKEVELKLDLEQDNYPRYRVELQNDNGETIWQSRDLQAVAGLVIVKLTGAKLSGLQSGDYRLVLRGAIDDDYQNAGSYYFKVIRE